MAKLVSGYCRGYSKLFNHGVTCRH